MGATLKDDFLKQGFELRETHISWVFLGKDRVYKVKKPVSLGFLDFSTLADRKAACEAEISLNRRLAPEVYVSMQPVLRDASGTHILGGEGEVVDYAVEMVRLADDASAQALHTRGTLTAAHIELLATRLAEFHRSCRADTETARFGEVETILGNVRENFEQTRVSGPAHLSSDQIAAIERAQIEFIEQHRERFAERIAEGYVRDGHGDLRLEHVYFDGNEVQIIDCIEFNDRFRYGDVCADLAFLSMDLAYNERVDFAELLLATYARESNDYGLYGLVDFYASYRAYVRAKVTAMMEAQADLADSLRAELHKRAHEFFVLAAAEMRPPLDPPVMIAVFGPIATGKSTLALQLSRSLYAPMISSDRIRKYLAGVSAETSVADGQYTGAYSPEMTARVYEHTLHCARTVLQSQRSIILDATCSRVEQRAMFAELAKRCDVPLLFVECMVPDDICRERLIEREKGRSISDGRISLLSEFRARYQQPTEVPAARLLRIDTTTIDDALVQAVLTHPALTLNRE